MNINLLERLTSKRIQIILFLWIKHEHVQNNKEWSWSFFFMDWRKDAIMFLWPLEEEEKLRFFHASKTAENR